jgi:hypothetical protein
MQFLKASRFQFESFDPAPVAKVGRLSSPSQSNALMALDRAQQYLFCDESGSIVHRYDLPDDSDILNCGGYIDKLLKYKQSDLINHLKRNGINQESLNNPTYPILQTRSPQLDFLIYRLLIALRTDSPGHRISLLDIGCTVSEHFDMLDIMLESEYGRLGRAETILDYTGVDNSPLVLAASRLLHGNVDRNYFKLILSEGSNFSSISKSYDIALSVGVINNFADPVGGTLRLINMSLQATVLALWACNLPDGVWMTSHHAQPIFLFGRNDLAALQRASGDKSVLVADYVPESETSQPRHFANVSEEAVSDIGCYHLVISRRTDIFSELARMEFT